MTTIAIVGRPNVGKSTLFNRILRKRIAIVDSASGVTRDRLYGDAEWCGSHFTIIDTGGVDLDSQDLLQKQVLEQIKISIAEADAVIFVTDVTSGVTPLDKEITRLLRQKGKDVVIAVNKVDNEKLANDVYSFSSLGWDRVVGISASHGLGIDKLLDALPLAKGEVTQPQALKVVIIGRPNVGKSTFVNAVLDKPRMIVDERPGTTRDSVDIRFTRKENPWVFIDTAGMRKRRQIKSPVEYYSVRRAYNSIDRADIVVLMIDGWEGIWKQDAQLADYIVKKEKPCVLAINKWDLVTEVTKREYRERITQRLAEYWYIPAVFISSLKKENLDNLLDKVEELFGQAQKRIQTRVLNKVLHKLSVVKVYYGTQIKVNPPTFLIFVNKLPDKQGMNYIKNQLHKAFEFEVPLTLTLSPKGRGKGEGGKKNYGRV